MHFPATSTDEADPTRKWRRMPTREGWHWYSEDLTRPEQAVPERVYSDPSGRFFTNANWWGEGPPIAAMQGYWLLIEDWRTAAPLHES